MNLGIKLLLLFCTVSVGSLKAQTIQVLMSPKPSPYISDWQEKTETATLILSNTSGNDIKVKVKTELFDGQNALVANTDMAKMPVITVPPGINKYNVEDIFPSNAIKYKGNLEKSTLKTGRIPDDNYTFCVTLTDPQTGANIGNTVCKMFNITAFQAPVLIAPANNSEIKESEIKGIFFRWSPVIPSPNFFVIYRLQIWEVLEGQSSLTALRSNQPIVEKDLKGILQTQWPVEFALPEAGRKYVWTVTPLDDQERKMVDGNGFADPFGFVVITPPPIAKGNNPTIALISPPNNSEISNNQKEVTFKWSAGFSNPQTPVTYQLNLWHLMKGQTADRAVIESKPVVTKTVTNNTEISISEAFDCVCCPPYLCGFAWIVRVLDKNGNPIENGNREVFEFHYTPNGQPPPEEGPKKTITLISPSNNSEITPIRNIKFSWDHIISEPQELVTYRLEVWQLMQGQNSTEAMRMNKPILTKDVVEYVEKSLDGLDSGRRRVYPVRILKSIEVNVNDIYTGPCRPPYLCDFIWGVQAIEKPGSIIIHGISEPLAFKIKDTKSSIILQSPKNGDKIDPLKEIDFKWTAIVPKPKEPVTYRLKVWQLMQGQNATQAMRTNQPIVSKDVDNITEVTISNLYTGPCRPPYLCDEMWKVQAIIISNGLEEIIGESESNGFHVMDGKWSSIKLESPKNLEEVDLAKEITFRWTPLVPKPQEPVTYRLKVWQLMQGQSSSQAMRSNKPIVEKDFQDILIDMKDQSMKAVLDIYTGPCKPPYLCDYVWNIQAINKDGVGIGDNNGKSESYEISGLDSKSSSITLQSPKNGEALDTSKSITFRWTPVVPKPKEPVTYRLNVWQLMLGQNSTQAMRTNLTIITKDVVDLTEITISNIYTGPCKPPYLCDYVWSITATNQGQSIADVKSKSSLFTLKGGENKNNGDPIHGVDVKFGFEKLSQIEQIQNIEIKLEVKLKNAKGDPIHGVDVKLGATAVNAEGNPIHGVDIKLGAASKSLNGQGDGVHGVVVKRGVNAKNLNSQGDPIHGVDIKLGFESKDQLLDSIYNVEIIATVTANDAQGDPIHGVDVKLGAVASDGHGDPVPGVVVKRGVK